MDLDHVGELIGLDEQAISAVERKLLVLEVLIPALRQTSLPPPTRSISKTSQVPSSTCTLAA